ncbi:MAG: hypothetical protein HY753_02260, partial [Nitrospirae bacterium]|nr:hypothetical protein [Nitrospirota bacterium]
KGRFGLDTPMVWQVDEPGHTLQLPQILNKSGIRYLVIWKEMTWEKLRLGGYEGPCLFNWFAPDGSKVIVSNCPASYGAGEPLRWTYEKAAKHIQKFTKRWRTHIKKWNLPDILMMADGNDCASPSLKVAKNIDKWNMDNKSASARLKISSTTEFFKSAEARIKKDNIRLPSVTGEIPSWWDGTQSLGNDTYLLSRRTDGKLRSAETLSTIASIINPSFHYPGIGLDMAWKTRLWVHDHSWGGNHGEVGNAVKLQKIRDAFEIAEDVLHTAIESLASRIKFKGMGVPIVVFNPLGWERRDIVQCHVHLLKNGFKNLMLKDIEGKDVPLQLISSTRTPDGSLVDAVLLFEACVPPFGYATYYLAEGNLEVESELSFKDYKIENRFFNITLDKKSGGICSIYDKRYDNELIDSEKFYANELIALENTGIDEGENFTGRKWLMRDYPSRISIKENGPVRTVVIIEGKFFNSVRKQEVVLYRNIARIDLNTEIQWSGKKNIQLMLTFPVRFKGNSSRLIYEVPFGAVQFGKESHYAKAIHPTVRGVQNWLDISGNRRGISFATEVSTFDMKDRTEKRFLDARKIKKGALNNSGYVIQPVLLRSLFCCYDGSHKRWGDKARMFFTQKGVHGYRFSLRPHHGNYTIAENARFGWEHNTPLVAFVPAERKGVLPDRFSFCEAEPDNILMTALKQDEGGRGIVIRCYETEGKGSRVRIKFFKRPKEAFLTNIIEERQLPLPIDKAVTKSRVGRYAIETFNFVL